MPIPDIANIGDSGHIQDHNDIVGVLTDHQNAIASKAPISSPTFTGVPEAPTASAGTNSTQIATTAFVQTAVSSGGGSYQPYDEDLASIAGLSGTSGILKKTAANTWSLDTTSYAPVNQTMFVGTTEIPINRTSGSLNLLGVSIDGNAGTVSNGVYTNSSYSDPSWITSLSKSKVGLSDVENTAISTWQGSTNINTLGTITTGTWNGNQISVSKGGTGLPSIPLSGQLLIGDGSGYTLSTLTAGNNIVITNGPGSITIEAVGGGTTQRNINYQTSSYTLVLSDAENIVTFTSASTLTIPEESTVNFSPATKISILQTGSNTVSISSQPGVTIVNRGDFSTTTGGAWTEAELVKIGTNMWAVLGQFNAAAGRALFAGGMYINSIDYITMSTSGNATSFGNYYAQVTGISSCGSSTRSLFAGGSTNTNVYYSDIGFVTTSTTGNTTSFGNMTVPRYAGAGLSSQTRGIFIGGIQSSSVGAQNTEFVTIATTGNGSSFGSLLENRTQFGSAASPTRGVFAGGGFATVTLNIEYITIATAGSSALFGQIGAANFGTAGGSSSTRAIFTREALMEYITIATTGNVTAFGNLTAARNYGLGTASRTAVFVGGGGSVTNTIDRTIISTLGNAANFGSLTVGRYWGAATSNAHGGIPE